MPVLGSSATSSLLIAEQVLPLHAVKYARTAMGACANSTAAAMMQKRKAVERMVVRKAKEKNALYVTR